MLSLYLELYFFKRKIRRMWLVQAIFKLRNNNQKNNGNMLVVIVEMPIEVEITMDLEIEIPIVVVVVLRTVIVNNIGEDHVRFLLRIFTM